MPASPWPGILLRLALLLVAASLFGLLIDRPALVLAGALAGYSAFQLIQLHRLERHLRTGAGTPPAGGIWGEIVRRYRRVQRRSRKRKRRLSALIREFQQSTAAMPDGTVVLSRELRIIWFNAAAERLLALRPAADVGQHLLHLLRVPAVVDYVQAGDYGAAITVEAPHRNGLMLSLQLVPYGQDQRLLIARDVTELHRLDRVRRDFVANASHELRTPLTVFSGYLEGLLADATERDDPLRGPLQAMHEQSARMATLVDQLLTLSRLDEQADPDQFEPVDVPALLRRLQAQAERLADHPLQIVLEVDDALWLRGIPSDLHSVAANLINNAVKYTPGDGCVRIVWRRVPEGAELAVSDTGPGIAPEHLPRLTERFYRVDAGRARPEGGTGLGLAIVKHALQRHHGELRIESTPGKGSRFSAIFPPAGIRVPALDDA